MIVHHFPGPTDGIRHRIREASVDSRIWHSVVGLLADRFPGARCALVFVAAATPHSAVRLTGTTICRIALEMLDGLDPGVLGPGWRVGTALPIGRRLTAEEGIEGGSLLLARTSDGLWIARLRSAGPLERRQGDAMMALLTRLSPALVEAFRLSLELETDGQPSRADLEANWDPLDHGAILMNASLRPHFANVAAEDSIAIRSLFRPCGRGGTLRATSPVLQDHLETAVDRIVSGMLDRLDLDTQEMEGRPRLTLRLTRAGSGPIGRIARSASARRSENLVLTIHQREIVAPAPFEPLDLAAGPRLASGF